MAEIGAKTKGTMAAILGLDEEGLKRVCVQASESGCVEIANYNCPGQLVISGGVDAVEVACNLAKQNGARRVIRLDVSGAFHSSLLKEASGNLDRFLERVRILEPRAELYQNVTGARVADPACIRNLLARQVSSPVRWEDIIRRMILDGYDSFTEVGPGTVLTGLIHQISKEPKRININSFPALKSLPA